MPTPNEPKDLQTPGRRENDAQPLDAAKDNAGAERYPDAENPSFEPKVRNETAPSTNDGRMGPGADPAEGKRD
jgi:hypothetical protein